MPHRVMKTPPNKSESAALIPFENQKDACATLRFCAGGKLTIIA
jgi:hypothetical protein